MSIRKYFIYSFYIKELMKKLVLYRYSYGLDKDKTTVNHYDGEHQDVPEYIFSLRDSLDTEYMVAGYYVLDGERWLTNVFVEEAYQRKGIAYTILRYLVSVYKINNVFVYEDNKEAIGLYKKLGFMELTRHSHRDETTNTVHNFIIMKR